MYLPANCPSPRAGAKGGAPCAQRPQGHRGTLALGSRGAHRPAPGAVGGAGAEPRGGCRRGGPSAPGPSPPVTNPASGLLDSTRLSPHRVSLLCRVLLPSGLSSAPNGPQLLLPH